MNIYLVIRRLCEEKGITINQLETNVGLGHRLISRWADHSPNVDTLKKVADYLGVTIDYLLNQDESEKQKNIVTAYNALNPENRELVDSLLDRLLKMQK